jgi:D-alanine-D-alanine ligase
LILAESAICDVTVLFGDPSLPDATKVGHRFSAEDVEAIARARGALAELPGYRFTFREDHRALLADWLAAPPPFVLNFCDTGYRNDARRELHVPALLELLGVPYSGSPPATLGLCFDKGHVRAIAARHGIPVPAEVFVPPGERIVPPFLPALLKPATGDGSFGITAQAVVATAEEAADYFAFLAREVPDRPVLVQEFLPGGEYGLALVGNPGRGFTLLPPLEVDYGALPAGLPPILSYESKTIPDSPYWTDVRFRPAKAGEADLAAMRRWSETLFALLGCRDYARFDFRADAAGRLRFLEVNPNPAWCWDGKMNIMAGFANRTYADLLGLILEAARGRVGG